MICSQLFSDVLPIYLYLATNKANKLHFEKYFMLLTLFLWIVCLSKTLATRVNCFSAFELII